MLEIVANKDLTDEEYLLIMYYMQHEPGIRGIFLDKLSRFYSASIIVLIKLDNVPIGFILAVSEGTRNLLFLDTGIIEKYRGHGYGTLAKQMLLERYNGEEYILTETKNNNVGANKSSSKIGNLLYQKGDINYYLLNSTIEEFKSSPAYQEFLTHIKTDQVVRQRVHE